MLVPALSPFCSVWFCIQRMVCPTFKLCFSIQSVLPGSIFTDMHTSLFPGWLENTVGNGEESSQNVSGPASFSRTPQGNQRYRFLCMCPCLHIYAPEHPQEGPRSPGIKTNSWRFWKTNLRTNKCFLQFYVFQKLLLTLGNYISSQTRMVFVIVK